MLLNFEHLKTFYSALRQKMKSFRGNWEQNDPTADDYIKNRPFYSEGKKEVTILSYMVDTDAQSATPMASAGPTLYQIYFEPSVDPFSEGQEYTVIWDKETYTCVAKDLGGPVTLGDPTITGMSGNSTGEPFILAINPDNGLGIILTTKAGKYPVVVKTRQEVVHKLDKKYIDMPDNIVTEDQLTDVAKTGSYNDLIDTPEISDVVRSSAQSLTEDEQAQARANIGAGTSNFSGNYIDLTNKPTIPYDTVRYNTVQYLTPAERSRARSNIGADKAVTYTEQTLSSEQQTQARANIGAGTSDFDGDYKNLNNVPNSLMKYMELISPMESPVAISTDGTKILALTAGGNVYESVDNFTWTLITTIPPLTEGGIWTSMCYNSSLKEFLAAGINTGVARSSDGITWDSTFFGTNPIVALSYGNANSMLLALDGVVPGINDSVTSPYIHKRIYSYNEEWSSYKLEEQRWTNICSDGYAHVAIAMGTDKTVRFVSTPTLGPYYETIPGVMPVSADWRWIAYGNGHYVAVAMDYQHCAVSDDGITWSLSTDTIAPGPIYFANGAFYIGEYVGSASNSSIWSSIDGITWQKHSTPISNGICLLGQIDEQLIGFQQEVGSYYILSPDGITWWDKIVTAADSLQIGNLAEIIGSAMKLEDANIPDTIARVSDVSTQDAALLQEAQAYTDSAIVQAETDIKAYIDEAILGGEW